MKIKDLARELSLSGDEVLEKAKAMGIKVSGTSDDLSDIDTTAVKNTILKGGTHTETKVVRTRAKKSDAEKKDGGPKVTVKAANIKLPEKKKTVKAASKPAVRTAAKPPAGRADRAKGSRRKTKAAGRQAGSLQVDAGKAYRRRRGCEAGGSRSEG